MIRPPRRFRLLAFDWDGTLADSTALIAGAIQQACLDVGVPAPDDIDARHVIGLGTRDAIRHVAPGLAADRHARFSDRFRDHYLVGDAAIPLFAGVRDMRTYPKPIVRAADNLPAARPDTRAPIITPPIIGMNSHAKP